MFVCVAQKDEELCVVQQRLLICEYNGYIKCICSKIQCLKVNFSSNDPATQFFSEKWYLALIEH